MAIGKSKKQILVTQKEYDVTGLERIAIPMTNIVDINPAAEGEDIDIVTTAMGSKRNYKDNYHTTVNFNVEGYLTADLEDFDNLGTPEVYSNMDSLLLQAGLKRTQSATDEVTYTPNSDENGALALDFYKEDIKRTIEGAKNSMTIAGEVGKPITVTFNISAYTDLEPTELAYSGNSADLTDLVIINKVTGYTEGGGTINMQSFTLNQNAELQDTYAIGLSQFDLTDFDPQLEVTALKIKNDISSWASFKTGALSEIIITAITSDGKTLEIKIPFAKILTNEEGDDAGRQTLVRNFRCENSVGDDNFSIRINQTVI